MIDPDDVGRLVPLDHPELTVERVVQTDERADQDNQQASMCDHKPGLPLRPGEPDEGRTQDVHPEECQKEGKPRALIDVLLNGTRAVPFLEERRVSEHPSEHRQADDR